MISLQQLQSYANEDWLFLGDSEKQKILFLAMLAVVERLEAQTKKAPPTEPKVNVTASSKKEAK